MSPPRDFAGNRQATILIADDLEGSRNVLRSMLASYPYRIICAEDGDQALELLRKEPVDLALLDVMMPGLTGFAVCEAIKSDPETRLIPVVLITGLDSVEDRVQGIRCGANDFLSKPVKREELVARVGSLLDLKFFTDELERAETVLYSLANSIEAKDPYTGGHCERLSKFSVALAERLRLPDEQIVALRRGGIVHDIGKVAVPESILLKPGPLTAAERKIMERHTVVGEHICSPLKAFRLVLPIIRHHHERMDGSGYPDGLKGEQIPRTARVLQTVDIFDALTTNRPYRKAQSSQEALAVMREEAQRGWWDHELIDEFASLLPQVERTLQN